MDKIYYNIGNICSNFLKKHVNSIIYLLLLTIIVSFIAYYRILVQIEMGPVSDSVVFLANALTFAGQGTGYSNLLFPPFFSVVVAIFFRLGYVFSATIFAVDGGLFVFGVIGLFLLLKTKFNDLESFLGGLLYATFPIVIIILGLGLSDLASVSFSIWALYFLVSAVKKDSRYFFLVFPFAMLAFLTRYNNALLIFPIFLYILINIDKINVKNVFIGIIAGIITIIPVLLFFFEKFGNIFYPFINFAVTSSMFSNTVKNPYYNTNIFYFLEKLPVLIGIQGILIILIIGLGIFIYLIYRLINKKSSDIHLFVLRKLKSDTKLKLLILVILGIIFLLSFGKTFYIVNEILFFLIAFITYLLMKNLNIKHLDLHILFFAWFMVFFIFHSIYVLKDVRYFVVMAPPLAYFMILGLSEISNHAKLMMGNRNISFPIISLILISLILISTASQIPHILETNHDNVIFNEQIENASQWFVDYDPNYKHENIYSDLWPNFSWFLKTDVKPVPVFKGNQSFLVGVIDFTFDQEDSNKFNQYLVNNNAEYYFSIRKGLNLTSYTPIKEFGDLIIYKKKTNAV